MKEKIRKLFSNVWTIPNILTILRMVLIPVFVLLFFSGHRHWALGVFLIASATDCLDGYLARRLNQITDFGKLFDPLADKLMVLTALVCQGIAGVFPWAAIWIVAAKELIMVLGGLFMLNRGVVVYSNYFGKTATVFFIVALILSFFHQELLNAGIVLFGQPVDIILLFATVVLALVAMAVYVADAVRKLRVKAGK